MELLRPTGCPLWPGKESACNAGDLGSIPGLGRSPGEGKGHPFQYSGLENSLDSIVHRVQTGGHDRATFTFTFFRPITFNMIISMLGYYLCYLSSPPPIAIHGFARSRTRLNDWTELNWTEHIYMESRMMIPKNLFLGQQWWKKHREHTYGHGDRGGEGDLKTKMRGREGDRKSVV